MLGGGNGPDEITACPHIPGMSQHCGAGSASALLRGTCWIPVLAVHQGRKAEKLPTAVMHVRHKSMQEMKTVRVL